VLHYDATEYVFEELQCYNWNSDLIVAAAVGSGLSSPPTHQPLVPAKRSIYGLGTRVGMKSNDLFICDKQYRAC
jgi:hypothetical protein